MAKINPSSPIADIHGALQRGDKVVYRFRDGVHQAYIVKPPIRRQAHRQADPSQNPLQKSHTTGQGYLCRPCPTRRLASPLRGVHLHSQV